jgi:hypothetical protein
MVKKRVKATMRVKGRLSAATSTKKKVPKKYMSRVYVVTSSGLRRRSSHIAKKARAREIVRSMGISKTKLLHVRKIVDRLEAEKKITRY